jgi:hypothetical protein
MEKLISKGYSRALIKMEQTLPNVSTFRAIKIGIDEFAANYGIEKIKRRHEVNLLNEHFQPNRYLKRQMYRMTRLFLEGKRAQAFYIGEILMKKSHCFRLLALNRIFPD